MRGQIHPWGYDPDQVAQQILSLSGDDTEDRAGAILEACFRAIWTAAYAKGFYAAFVQSSGVPP